MSSGKNFLDGKVATAVPGERVSRRQYFVANPISVGMVAACFDVWPTYCGSERFSLGWYLAKVGSVFTSRAVMASLFHDVTRLYGRLASVNATLQDLAGRDGLTGLFNRRRLDEALALEWLRTRRDRQPISVLMIDVDHFKGFNDTYGHLEGDACLRRLAAVLQEATRRPGRALWRRGIRRLPARHARRRGVRGGPEDPDGATRRGDPGRDDRERAGGGGGYRSLSGQVQRPRPGDAGRCSELSARRRDRYRHALGPDQLSRAPAGEMP